MSNFDSGKFNRSMRSMCPTPRTNGRRKLDEARDLRDNQATAFEEIDLQFIHSVLPMTLVLSMEYEDGSSNTGVINNGSAARRRKEKL